jgi:hypothetical protein
LSQDGSAVWFLGDLEDPWVAAVADALPASTRRIACPGDLPGDFADKAPPPRVVVVHRAILTAFDAERVARLRTGLNPAPRVVLCIGPHVRHADLERWSARGLMEAVVSEATARDTVARHLAADDGNGAARRADGMGAVPRPPVAVVSTNTAMQRTLAEACQALGYPVEPVPDWSAAPPTGLAVWDVPVLEPEWSRALTRRCRLGPVVALLGFADRAVVTQARESGASACLELPVELRDLGHVLDRITTVRGESGHAVPPPSLAARRRTRRQSGSASTSEVAGPGPGP